MKRENSKNYFACLVRFWRENDTAVWRVTVEDPHTNVKENFADPDAFWRHLQTILASPAMDPIYIERENDE